MVRIKKQVSKSPDKLSNEARVHVADFAHVPMPASSHILLHLLGFAHFYLSVKNHCYYLFQLLEADDNPAHGVQRPVDHLLVDAARLPLLLPTLELLLPLLLRQHPGGFHASRLTQPGKCTLCLWLHKVDVLSSEVKLLDVLPSNVLTVLCHALCAPINSMTQISAFP